MIAAAHGHSVSESRIDEWLRPGDLRRPGELGVDLIGYAIARVIGAEHGDAGLREAVTVGPDRFIALYNALSPHTLKT